MEKFVLSLIKFFENKDNRFSFIVIFSIVLIVAIGLSQVDIFDKVLPCSKLGYPGRCYSIEANVCEDTWQDLEIKCKNELMKTPANRTPGRLLSLPINNCQMVQYDYLFRYTRKNQEESCKDQFSLVEELKRSNPNRL